MPTKTEMKTWVKKIAEQFEVVQPVETKEPVSGPEIEISEERATLIYFLDVLNKHIIETEHSPSRRSRETFDEFIKSLVDPAQAQNTKILFRLRQFFSSHRLDEYTYVQKSFDEFKRIIWDFADQLSEDLHIERAEDKHIEGRLDDLKNAVESNSINVLKVKSREFIDSYSELQTRRETRREVKLSAFHKNLSLMKKQLTQAQENLKVDHLTQAYNRKSFDDQIKKYWQLNQLSSGNISLLAFDIDHFKKINDRFGHPTGDFVLKEFTRCLKTVFHRSQDFVARTGGEEFLVLLPDYNSEASSKKAEELRKLVEKEAYVISGVELKYTVSIGIAQLLHQESVEEWMKRADTALYESKNSGRNKSTLAGPADKSAQKAG